MNLVDWLCFLVIVSKYCLGQNFQVPDVTFVAFEPSGLEASIPAEEGIELFALHANLNREIDLTEQGEIAGDVKVDPKKSSNVITFSDPNVKLKVGDVVNYWIYVQYKFLGYRKESQKWQVTVLKRSPAVPCALSKTKVEGQMEVCKNTTIFEDNFNLDSVNKNNWIIEQYIPRAPDHEFVVYKKDQEATFVDGDFLHIRPKLITDSAEIAKDLLDLSSGCTRTTDRDCINEKFIIQNPIISGKLTSKFAFRYAEVEIKARLPSGDWMYPQVYLEGENGQKILIAYARGNEQFAGSDGVDVGGSFLFAGPILNPKEPERSAKLSSLKAQTPFSHDFHVYRLRWTEDKMDFYVDNKHIGEVNTDIIKNSSLNDKNVRLVLGVGVGGVNDFPDGFKSKNFEKPWRNSARLQVKKFYESKSEWYDKTWGSDSQLQVDFVRIRSL